MTKPILWWALKSPEGKIIQDCISPGKEECWNLAFWFLAKKIGDGWKAQHWKRVAASRRSAKRLGYKMVRVKITEAK